MKLILHFFALRAKSLKSPCRLKGCEDQGASLQSCKGLQWCFRRVEWSQYENTKDPSKANWRLKTLGIPIPSKHELEGISFKLTLDLLNLWGVGEASFWQNLVSGGISALSTTVTAAKIKNNKEQVYKHSFWLNPGCLFGSFLFVFCSNSSFPDRDEQLSLN